MTEKEKITFKIWFLGSDGKNYTQSIRGFRQDLGVCRLESDLKALWRAIDELRNDITKLYMEKLTPFFIAQIRENPDMTTTQVNELFLKISDRSNTSQIALQRLFSEMEESGDLIPTSHGKGHNRTWRVKE